MSFDYEEMEEDYESYLTRCDFEYDMMRDEFATIQNEDDAKNCIRLYPNFADRFMPNKYRYLLEKNNGKRS